MKRDQELRAELQRTRQEMADNDLMLRAYGRYWLPVATRIADALEKIEVHLAKLACKHESVVGTAEAEDDK